MNVANYFLFYSNSQFLINLNIMKHVLLSINFNNQNNSSRSHYTYFCRFEFILDTNYSFQIVFLSAPRISNSFLTLVEFLQCHYRSPLLSLLLFRFMNSTWNWPGTPHRVLFPSCKGCFLGLSL